MTDKEAALWFKTQFQAPIAEALAGTPFTLDLLTAIAMQETGYLWRRMIQAGLGVPAILELCVGDSLDRKKAFPKDKADLLTKPWGQQMFDIARDCLERVAQYDTGYQAVLHNPNKFCHGFGIFQYDLQSILDDPDYFLQRQWASFPACLDKALMELKGKLVKVYGPHKTTLTDTEQIYVAIAYNAGSVNLSKGFQQGYKGDDGRYYGENVFAFLRVAQTVSADGGGGHHQPDQPPPHLAPLPPPSPVVVTGDLFQVHVDSVLRLRSAPVIPPEDQTGNIVARLPNGQIVHRLAGADADQFWQLETSLNGARYTGYADHSFLAPAPAGVNGVPVMAAVAPAAGVIPPAPDAVAGAAPAPVPVVPVAEGNIPAVFMPRAHGSITRRTGAAGATSLNEPGQPGRQGTTAAERCQELAAIIDWLGVDNDDHQRYQPTSTATFCNIYAHDYCYLAGVYLPRVWWLPGAIERLARGEDVPLVYEQTIDEQRANDLCRWLQDFGPRFGWRATGTLTKLQEAANLGGIGIIVARRKDDGRSGHIVVVVPEQDAAGRRARRNSAGEVIAPLQSQAGSSNFEYGTGQLNWWMDDRFAASGFYIHA